MLAYLQLPPLPEVTWWGLPAPTVLTVGGVLAGLMLAGLARIGVEVGARRRMARARQVLRSAIAKVTGELVVAPVQAEQDRYERARLALERVALRGWSRCPIAERFPQPPTDGRASSTDFADPERSALGVRILTPNIQLIRSEAMEALVHITGYAGTEVEVRGQGTVSSFRLACTPRVRVKGGEYGDGNTTWIEVSCFRALAEHVAAASARAIPFW